MTETQMASNSALAGDSTHAGWGDKKPQAVGGWNERRSRWREDERDVAGARASAGGGHGWTADRRDRARGREGASFPAPLPPHPTGGGSALLGDGNGNATRDAHDLGERRHGPAGTGPGGGAPAATSAGVPYGGQSAPAPSRGAGVRAEPARPDGGRGFSVGRGRGGGFGAAGTARTFAFASGAGAPRPQTESPRVGLGGVVLGGGGGGGGGGGLGPHPQFGGGPVLRTALSGGVPAPAEPIQRHGPVRFKYTHAELRSLRAALGAGAALPAPVDPDSVPLATVKPGDAMWELTVEGARGGAARGLGGSGREWATTTMGDVSRGGISAIPAPKLPVASHAASHGASRGFGGGAADASALTAAAAARFDAAQSSWLTEGADAGGALESETENTNRGGGLAGDPDVDDNDGHAPPRAEARAAASAAGDSLVASHESADGSLWIYKDPSGTHQGPFTRSEMLEWLRYFPPDLPLRPAEAPPDAPFAPLAEMLACGWRYPGPSAEHARAEREKAARAEEARAEEARHEEARRRRAEEERAEQDRHAREQQHAHQMRQQAANLRAANQAPVAPNDGGTGWIGGGPPRSLADLEGSAYGGVSSPPGPGGHANLLANLFSGGGGQAGGAPPPPPPGGGVSLADLERSMAAGDAPPPAPRPGSFDAAPTWGGAPGGDAGSGWVTAPAPGAQQAPAPPAMQPATPPAQPAWGGGGAAPAAQKSLAEIQREEEERAAARRREAEARAEANPGVFGGGGLATAWGGGGAAAGPSLAQIQAEELRRSAARAAAAQQQAKQQRDAFGGGGGPGPAGAWAGGASAAMRAAPAGPPRDVEPTSLASQGRQQHPQAGGGFWDSLPSTGSAGTSSAARPDAGAGPGPGPGWGAPTSSPMRSAPNASAPEKEKGDFKAFCRAEMRALNDSDDLTLVDFLLSLPSAGEVTEYVQLYLGNSPRAAAFGNELIRAKRANPGAASVEDLSSGGGGAVGDAGEFKKAKRRGKK